MEILTTQWLVAAVLVLTLLGACGMLVWQLMRQQRQLALRMQQLTAQVSVFADASISVAQTVEQALVVPKSDASHNRVSVAAGARRELLMVAQRRMAQGQPPKQVQQALALSDDECRLLAIGQSANGAVAAEPAPASAVEHAAVHSVGQPSERPRHWAVA